MGPLGSTPGGHVSVGGFLCALRAQDWGNHFEIYIFVMDKVCQLLGNICQLKLYIARPPSNVLEGGLAPFRYSVVECGLYITVFVCLYSCISESNIW